VTDVDPRWYDGFFEAEWLDYLSLPSDPEVTVRGVEFIVEQLALEPGASVLDVACGRGRHSVELARRGFRVTGIDLSPRSLELARAAAAEAGIEAEFRRLDMRELDYDGLFDGAINVFTSFGYFEQDEENERVLHRIVRALRPGGRFVIDTINPIALARVFRERDWKEFDDGSVMTEHRWQNQLTGRGGATWTFIHRDGSRSVLDHSVRFYAPWELRILLERAGLEVERAWGSSEGTELGDGTRTILVAQKAA
jgi:2-polyprenyl-3-methyl-5-hydroxy-6-metoxy-1,4-benzoquinol methylase